MARLDKLIQVLHDQRGDAIRLAAGRPAALQTNGGSRPLTREPLSEQQIAGLLREISPAGTDANATFVYLAPAGAIRASVEGAGAELVAMLTREGGGVTAVQAMAPPDDGPARAAIETLLRELATSGASDLHLRSNLAPVYRRGGELVKADTAPISGADLEAMLSAIMSAPNRAEFAERGDVDWAYEIEGVSRFRCNAGMDRHGAFLVVRAIPTTVLSVDDLGLSREVQNLCFLTKGLVVVTGPTGSGKSTTLAAMIDLVNRTRSDHILTIEDPIEFVHQSKQCLVTQRQVGVHTHSFKNALRAALREDPDVVLVGEMRDLETVSIAIETAETGHLVFGTLHTTTAASTIDRIIDQFPADRQAQVRVMLSESLRGVIAQTLCKKKGGGRVAAREVLLTIPAISNLIREGKTFQIPSIMQTNRKVGMVTLNDCLLDLVDKGEVEPQEAYMKAVDKGSFAAALKAKRHDTSFLGDVA